MKQEGEKTKIVNVEKPTNNPSLKNVLRIKAAGNQNKSKKSGARTNSLFQKITSYKNNCLLHKLQRQQNFTTASVDTTNDLSI